jgi:hypothetical protein
MMHIPGTTKKIFNAEMLEGEKEIEARRTAVDEVRCTAKLNLINGREIKGDGRCNVSGAARENTTVV